MNTHSSYTNAMNTWAFKQFVFLFKILLLSAVGRDDDAIAPLYRAFHGLFQSISRHCPSCVKRCRCAYTGGTWLLRCCQLLLHLFLATCNKRAPDCSGASQCLLPHPQPLSYYFFQSQSAFDMINLVFCQWADTINKFLSISKMFS